MQSGLLNQTTPNPYGSDRRPYLTTGRVTAPMEPGHPDFKGYTERCLRSWSVDVILDTGEYLQSCRVMSVQGNQREGLRRLPRLPQVTASGEVIPGDSVVVSFLHGAAGVPVILGTIAPLPDPELKLDDLEQVQVTTRDPNERQDRHEYIDLNDPEKPLITAHMTRSTGLMVETEHSGVQRIDGKVRSAQALERRKGGRDVETEQMVEVDDTTTAALRTSNKAGATLRQMHAVKGSEGTAMVIIEDLKAQVLQLTHQVNELSKLVIKSDKADALLLQQETKDLRTTVYSDSASKTVGVLAEDLNSRTRAGWSIGPKGELIVRRLNASSGDTKIEFNDDDSMTLQVPSGPTVHLEKNEVLVTSGSTSVRVSDTEGVNMVTKGGTMVSAFDDAVVVTAPAVTLNAGNVHLSTGSVLVGQSAAGAFTLPAAEKLQVKMAQIEAALKTLAVWARTHVHTSTPPSTPTSPSVIPLPPSASPSNLFNLATDTLKSIKGV